MDKLFNDASIIMTVVSLLTFIGILWWTYCYKRGRDFDAIANLPLHEDVDVPSDSHREKYDV